MAIAEASYAMETSPPPSASERPPTEDEPELTREALETAAARRGAELRPLLNAVSLALAAVLVIVVGSVGIQHLRSSSAESVATQATPSPTIPPTPAPPLTPAPTLPAGQGWTPVGPPWAQSIVFAPSAPLTAYICGTPANSDGSQQAPVTLGISHDAGHTWQTTATAPAILATRCQLDVDPTDAYDLLLQIWRCTACTTPLPAQLYRSMDGGQSWHLVTLPAGGSGAVTVTAYQWAWQGPVLFVNTWVASSAGVQSQNALAISPAQGPFAWVNARALLAGVPSNFQLTTVYTTSSAVYADFLGPSDCTGDCEVIKRSTDLGVTGTGFSPPQATPFYRQW